MKKNEMTSEEIEVCENAKEAFMELWRENVQQRQGAREFMAWLKSTDFFTAPASTRYHGAFPGGLVCHSVAVAENTLRLLDMYGATEDDRKRAVLVGLLHDVCKANFYVEGSTRQKDQYGALRDVRTYSVQDKLPLGHGEKSIYLVQRYMELEDREAVAMRWHMGAYCDQQQYGTMATAFGGNPLALFLHLADMIDAYYMP